MDYLKYLEAEIHTVVMATADENGLPITYAVDIVDSDGSSLYFLTPKGKSFYERLKNSGYVSLTGIKRHGTLSCVSVSVRGKVREIGGERLLRLFEKNPYMHKIYPTERSRKALTVFGIYEGAGELFDLSKSTIKRADFTFGNAPQTAERYVISDKCTACKACQTVCPQSCIDFSAARAIIKQENCLRCGNCFVVCPVGAVEKRKI